MPPARYRFDRFELRLDERLLYRDGQATPVAPRAVDVLAVLVSAQGRLVSKNELLDRAWPNLVVEDNNLHVQISALRRCMGEQAIATLPGRGYRFCLPVVAEDAGPGEGGEAVPPEASSADLGSAAGVNADIRRGKTGDARRVLNRSVAAGQSEPPIAPDPLGTLPTPGGRLWGREAEHTELDLQLPAALISIVGPAGIGKTAFALSVAHAWRGSRRDGVAWVELAGIADPELVVHRVARSLGVGIAGDVAGARALESLVAALQPLQVLLVIDNAEHVLDAVTRLATAITQGAPDVRLLVTSQVPLRVPGERVFRLGPLSVPADDGVPLDDAMQHGAVALFVDAVRAVDHRFALDEMQLRRIIGLCRQLDGVALAIKLAAARVPLLGLQGLQARLGERFRLLQDGRPTALPRQQTLLAALDWSHELLGPAERAVFRRLAIATGGFSLHLARALAPDQDMDEWAAIDVLSKLVDRSLVMSDAGEWPRYRLLDTMREYALLQLQASGEQQDMRRRHAHAMGDIMRAAYEAYWAQADAPWLAQYGADIDNVRAAIEWATQHDHALALRLLGASGPLFMLLGLAAESRQRGQALEALAQAMPADADVARYWLERSRLHWGIGNTAMHDMAGRAAAMYRAAGDGLGLYLALRCQAGSGVLPPTQALAVLQELAALEQPDWPARVRTQRMLAQAGVLRAMEHMAEARRVCQNLLVTAQAAGLEGVVSATLSDLASVTLALGDTDGAMRACQQLLARGRHRRDNFVLHALAIVACVSFVRSDLPGARAALTEFIAASRSRQWEWLGLYAGLLALLAALEGRHEAAARLLGYAGRAHEALGTRDVLTVYAWSRASARVKDALETIVLQRLQEMGREMDADAACGWALAQA